MRIGRDHFGVVVLVAGLIQGRTIRKITNIVDKSRLREWRTSNMEVGAGDTLVVVHVT